MLRVLSTALRVTKPFRAIALTTKPTLCKREFTRTLGYLSKEFKVRESLLDQSSFYCSCGCSGHRIHTKGERELVEFLTEEIVAEKKAQKVKTIPTQIDGFNVKLNGADVELSRETKTEKIVISFNVNHTVDTDEDPDIDPNAEKSDLGEMKSKPTFEVDIVKGKKTLSFTCSFLQGGSTTDQEGYNDVFGIDEITLFEGEWNDKCYAVAGDVLDGYLYDLLMNILEEKGISNEFAEKLSDFATAYEHSSYIRMLEEVSKFTVGEVK